MRDSNLLRVIEQGERYLVVTIHEDNGTFDGVAKVFNPETQSWEIGDTFTIRAR